MIKVVGVCFEKSNKIYYFLPNDNICNLNDFVIVETERGLQYGKVSTKLIEVDETKILIPVKNILRIATLEDAKINEKNVKDNERAIKSANKFIKELGIDMKILNASFTFDRNQLLFNFLADDRVDFRELAKKLASVYKTRIELRQIGVRDKAKEVGGIGQCGRTLCCYSFLNDMSSVSINMAKNQNLALNPTKINGACGRLMCCLAYENDFYKECRNGLPSVGDNINTNDVTGKVIDVDILKRSYKVEKDNGTVVEIKL